MEEIDEKQVDRFSSMKRRSSILKPPKTRNEECNITVTDVSVTKTVRRVSFANSKTIKPFAQDPERNTIWDTTYEESAHHTNSTQSSQEAITQNATTFGSAFPFDLNATTTQQQSMDLTRLVPEFNDAKVSICTQQQRISIVDYARQYSDHKTLLPLFDISVNNKNNAINSCTCQGANHTQQFSTDQTYAETSDTNMSLTCQIPRNNMQETNKQLSRMMDLTDQGTSSFAGPKIVATDADTNYQTLTEVSNANMSLTCEVTSKNMPRTNERLSRMVSLADQGTSSFAGPKVVVTDADTNWQTHTEVSNANMSLTCQVPCKNMSRTNERLSRMVNLADQGTSSFAGPKIVVTNYQTLTETSDANISLTCQVPRKHMPRTNERLSRMFDLADQRTSSFLSPKIVTKCQTRTKTSDANMSLTCQVDNKSTLDLACPSVESVMNIKTEVAAAKPVFLDDTDITCKIPQANSTVLNGNDMCDISHIIATNKENVSVMLDRRQLLRSTLSRSVDRVGLKCRTPLSNVTRKEIMDPVDNREGVHATDVNLNACDQVLRCSRDSIVDLAVSQEPKRCNLTRTVLIYEESVHEEVPIGTSYEAERTNHDVINISTGHKSVNQSLCSPMEIDETPTTMNVTHSQLRNEAIQNKDKHQCLEVDKPRCRQEKLSSCKKQTNKGPKMPHAIKSVLVDTADKVTAESNTRLWSKDFAERHQNPDEMKSKTRESSFYLGSVDSVCKQFKEHSFNISSGVDDTQQLLQGTFHKSIVRSRQQHSEDTSLAEESPDASLSNAQPKTNKWTNVNDTYVLKTMRKKDGELADFHDSTDTSLGIIPEPLLNDELPCEHNSSAIKALTLNIDNIKIKHNPVVDKTAARLREQHRQIKAILENFQFGSCPQFVQTPPCEVSSVNSVDIANSALSIEDRTSSVSSASDADTSSIEDNIRKHQESCQKGWQFEKMECDNFHFTTLFGTLTFVAKVNIDSEKVVQITTANKLRAGSKPIARYIMKLMLEKLDENHIKSAIGSTYNILSLLDYVQLTMLKIYEFYIEYLESWKLTIEDGFIAKYKLLSRPLVLACDVVVDLHDIENLDCEKDIKIISTISIANETELRNLARNCEKGIDFFMSFYRKVKDYLEVREKRKRGTLIV